MFTRPSFLINSITIKNNKEIYPATFTETPTGAVFKCGNCNFKKIIYGMDYKSPLYGITCPCCKTRYEA